MFHSRIPSYLGYDLRLVHSLDLYNHIIFRRNSCSILGGMALGVQQHTSAVLLRVSTFDHDQAAVCEQEDDNCNRCWGGIFMARIPTGKTYINLIQLYTTNGTKEDETIN